MTIDDIRKLHYKEEGREEGEMKKAVEIAKKLLRKGVSIDIVVESTELTMEEVESINKELFN
ncbi:hypothetical protein LL037_08630 [Clostridium estertheticum]|uniref:Uncharacterized protein n=1 Tax=Clostridium estertheticum TaxID=238834 RepID=A0AA47I5F3_9CLOT|nr:hypothetical protein [Clostridium estertheticum]MBU3154961.1 hypothetical protein [Clostridium estertheticum]MBU3200345.1 hypothetical protein [Clostridium estertheticum]WAG58780.1 hypothetical protein LL038_14065 [Clostridium estertheticum]WAG67179.1 hypothetical protein LL037_08630 [Clostridium estertheticum]